MKNKIFKDMMRKLSRNRREAGKRISRVTVVTLCAALALGEAGAAANVYAAGGAAAGGMVTEGTASNMLASNDNGSTEAGKTAGAGTADKAEAGGKASEPGGAAARSGDGELAKDETVYVLANADGSVRKIIVSDWIKNGPGADRINDISELTDTENVKSDEIYTLGDGNTRVWDAQGNDIYYQGTIEKELPVTLAVSYTLDGKRISPEELAGKSGKVTIRFDYTNNQYEYVDIGGENTKIYVPFAMMTGMLLDDDIFTNVEVSNGKLVNDGGRTAVVGIAFPGLEENLGVDSDKLEIPGYVEITADVKDFEMGMTATVATNEVFSSISLDKDELTGDLSSSMDELTDAMGQLMDGSSELYDGLCTLLEKSGDLIDGIDKLAAGASELRSGAGTLDEGAGKLQTGAAKLSDGLNTLSSKNGELNGGARQIFDTLLAAAQTQLGAAGLDAPAMTAENYAEVLNGVIASLDETAVYQQALSQVTAAVEEQRGYIENQVTAVVQGEVTSKVEAAVREQVTEKVKAAAREQVAPQVEIAVREQVAGQAEEAARAKVTSEVIRSAAGMDEDSYYAAVAAGAVSGEIQAAVDGAIEEQMGSDAVKAMIEAKVEEQMGSDAVKAAIEANVEEQMAGEAVKAMIDANVEEQMAGDTVKAMIDANVAQQMQDEALKNTIAENTELQVQKAISENMAGDAVQEKLVAASEGARSVIALKASLDSYNAFYLGLQAYTAGVAEAAGGANELSAGANELKAGTGKLSAGTVELHNGILAMKDSAPALIDGITQLKDGAMQLSEGLQEFNEEGIRKLADAVEGGLESLTDRLHAISDVSKRYKSFAGIDDGMDGNVKFIYRTDSIEAE